MPQETVTLAILFADIARSSQCYEILGDKKAQRLISKCLLQLSDVAYQHLGSVIKTIGDEVMCTFPDADRAVAAARAMHQCLDRSADAGGTDWGTPNVYIGIHAGPVIRGKYDVYGDAVNTAARMKTLANPRQILISEQTADALTREHHSLIKYVGKERVKGKSGELNIYEYVWEQADMTTKLDRAVIPSLSQTSLALNYADKTLHIDRQHPGITMGRQRHNDLVLKYERISRTHARIEYRRGKFTLIDQSSNGTYVHIQGQADVYIIKDETSLHGTGIISLGRKAAPGSPGAIHFNVK